MLPPRRCRFYAVVPQTRMTGAGRPIPHSTEPAGFSEAVVRHFNLMEGLPAFCCTQNTTES